MYLVFLAGLAVCAMAQPVPRQPVPPTPRSMPPVISQSPNGRWLAVRTFPRGLQVWDVRTGRVLNSIPFVDTPISGMGWSPDGKRIALVTLKNRSARQIEIWNPLASGAEQTFPVDETAELYFDPVPAWSPDGKQIAMRTMRGALVLETGSGKWTAIAEPAIGERAPSRFAGGFSWAPDSRRLAIVAGDRETDVIDIWDLQRMAVEKTIPAWRKAEGDLDTTAAYSLVAWSPNGRSLAVCSRFSKISVWDARTGQLVFRSDQRIPVEFFSWSANSRLLHVATMYQIRFFRRKKGTLAYVVEDMGRAMSHVSVSAKGERIAAAELDGGVVFWRGHNDRPRLRLAPDQSGNWKAAPASR